MRKRHALLVIPAVVLLGLMAYVTGITGIFTVRGAPSPPFPQWIERTSSINPECNWGEALVVNWEVNPSHYNIQARGIDRQGNTIIRSNVPDICLGTEGMTCQFSETFPAQADLAWGRVELEAEGGVVDLSGECQG
jgi:hypothetical protein